MPFILKNERHFFNPPTASYRKLILGSIAKGGG